MQENSNEIEPINKQMQNNSKTLKIVLKTDEVDVRPVYLAGNFNNWRTQDRAFIMQQIGENLYQFEFKENFKLPEELFYKFTKGDWSEVEIDAKGDRTENRSTRKQTGVQEEFVARWRKSWLPFKQHYLPQVVLLSDEFEIPQLNKSRKIWALLPHDYDDTTEKYPVMYLQDAQNLFDQKATTGNWEIDKKLAVMSEYKVGKIIIIAIEHAGEERIKEYSIGDTHLGKGQGKEYIEFVTQTLKPFVDKTFRTKTEREYTGMGGSNMGALISAFSGLRYPSVFSRFMLFSPTLWMFPQLKIDQKKIQDTKIYIYAGAAENDNMIEQVFKFKDLITETNNALNDKKIDLNLSINEHGKHNEKYWSDEFPKSIEWLFFNHK